VEKDVGVEVFERGSLFAQVSVRRLNGKGVASLMKAEGCTKWTNP
jgi:hypothetical protein